MISLSQASLISLSLGASLDPIGIGDLTLLDGEGDVGCWYCEDDDDEDGCGCGDLTLVDPDLVFEGGVNDEGDCALVGLVADLNELDRFGDDAAVAALDVLGLGLPNRRDPVGEYALLGCWV